MPYVYSSFFKRVLIKHYSILGHIIMLCLRNFYLFIRNSKVNYCFSGLMELRFPCPNFCGRSYKNKCSIKRHLKYECEVEPKFECLVCYKKFTQKVSWTKHMIIVHKNIPLQ